MSDCSEHAIISGVPHFCTDPMEPCVKEPASLWLVPLLEGWADAISARYNAPVYLVGSALSEAHPRDVDIRVVLTDEQFESRYGSYGAVRQIGPIAPEQEAGRSRYYQDCAKLGDYAQRWHARGRLNVDFQVQCDSEVAAKGYSGGVRLGKWYGAPVSTDTIGVTAPTFVKHDEGKVQFDLLPFDALEEVAKVLGHGAEKYPPDNWRAGACWRRYFGAALRHLFAWFRRSGVDPESGRSHLAHAACCILFLIAYEMHGYGTDDRPEG